MIYFILNPCFCTVSTLGSCTGSTLWISSQFMFSLYDLSRLKYRVWSYALFSKKFLCSSNILNCVHLRKKHVSRNMRKLPLLQLWLRRYFRISVWSLSQNLILISNLSSDLRGQVLRPFFAFFVSFSMRIFLYFKSGRDGHCYYRSSLLVWVVCSFLITNAQFHKFFTSNFLVNV